MRTTVLVSFLLSVVATLGFAASAQAATVSFAFVDDYETTTPVVQYTAAPGEANRLTVALSASGRTATVKDPGASITPGDNCTAIDAHAASCTMNTLGIAPDFEAQLGDRDDAMHVGSVPAAGRWGLGISAGSGANRIAVLGHPRRDDLRGGDENDRIAGSQARDVVEGGGGRDVIDGSGGNDYLQGGPGADVIRGGSGNDELEPEGPEPDGPPMVDHLDGGPGLDVVGYPLSHRRVRVNLARKTATDGGHPDAIRSIEGALGGYAADVLVGSNGPNVLDGGFSDGDVLRGRGGDDHLNGHDARGLVDGGAGDDVIRISNKEGHTNVRAVTVGCGTGQDTVVLPIDYQAAPPLLPATCNRTSSFFDLSIHAGVEVRFSRPHVAGGVATVRVDSGKHAVRAGLLTLRTGSGKILGRATYRAGKGLRRGRIHLTAAGRRAAQHHQRVLLRNHTPPGTPLLDQEFTYALHLGR